MEQNFGLISIIMAAYNAENTIEKAVMSVMAQTYTQFEPVSYTHLDVYKRQVQDAGDRSWKPCGMHLDS